MRLRLIILLAAGVGCVQPPATFRPVDYPATGAADWIKSGPQAPLPGGTLPSGSFAEEPGEVSAIRVTASPEDFYGSKLYDGFDVLVQPLDAQNRPVKKLGKIEAVLYRFEGDSLQGEGEKLLDWGVSDLQMAHLWGEKGIDRGYRMKLAWHLRPMVKDVKLDVRFTTRDTKVFTKIISAGSVDQPRYRWLDK